MTLIKYNCIALILLSLTACSLFSEDLTLAQDFASQGHYAEAISILDTHKSNASQKYNSTVRVEYGEKILKDLERDQQERYSEAKDLFETALKLDAKNTRARVLYLAVLKLEEK
jgi:hypothetical protein